MSIFDWLKLIAQFFPAILQVVMAIEAAIPTATGATKKSVAMAIVNPPAAQAAGVSTAVDTLVTALNTTGVFANKTSAPAA